MVGSSRYRGSGSSSTRQATQEEHEEQPEETPVGDGEIVELSSQREAGRKW
jgi:hypothetical protein